MARHGRGIQRNGKEDRLRNEMKAEQDRLIKDLTQQLREAKENERKIRFCWEQDAKKLAWWNNTFQSFTREQVLNLAMLSTK